MRTNEYKTAEDYEALGRALKKNTSDAYDRDIRRFLNAGYTIYSTVNQVKQYLIESAQGANGTTLSPQSLDIFLGSLKKRRNDDPALRDLTESLACPTIKQCMDGIRSHHSKPPKQAGAFITTELIQIYDYLAERSVSAPTELEQLTAIRDQALLSCGFWRGLRADSIGHIRSDSVKIERGIASMFIPKAKQVKDGSGLTLTFEPWAMLNPVDPIMKWSETLPLGCTKLFPAIHFSKGVRYPETGMNRKQVGSVLKGWCHELGIDGSKISAHSLRHSLGFFGGRYMTIPELMNQGDWQSVDSVMKYIGEGDRIASIKRAISSEMLMLGRD